jgi:hypothetical protein
VKQTVLARVQRRCFLCQLLPAPFSGLILWNLRPSI